MLPVVVFWLILIGPNVHASIPYDSLTKCNQAGISAVNQLKSKGISSTDFICLQDTVDIPALDYFIHP